ncbi:MAG: hypothetical protein ABIJ81_01185 [Patescibacteria group bacterium]
MQSINKRLLAGMLLLSFLMVGIMLGYGSGINEGTSLTVAEVKVNHLDSRVLGAQQSNLYVNPFHFVDAKKVKFPVSQIKGCRNYTECSNACGDPENFAACSAWFKGQ